MKQNKIIMRKVFLMMAMMLPILLISGCSDNENDNPKSVMVNVKDSYGIASPSLVMLYNYSEAMNFDKNAISEMGDKQDLIDMDGNIIQPVYVSDSFSGVNIFDDVVDGEYMLIVLYHPEGYSFPMFYYYGFKKIVVNDENNAKLYEIDFSGKETGKFIEF